MGKSLPAMNLASSVVANHRSEKKLQQCFGMGCSHGAPFWLSHGTELGLVEPMAR